MTAADAARALINAYVADDRAAVEDPLAPDVRFTSPYDNGIDRETYFRLCWPNHEGFEGVEIVEIMESGNRAAMTYEARFAGGRAFRNTEVFTVRDGRVAAIEVYFGWSLPHPVPPGRHDHEIGRKANA